MMTPELMHPRATIILLVLVALALAGRALAHDNSACAQYQKPIAYNACLARHGPKASDLAARPTHGREGWDAPGGAERSEVSKSTPGGLRRLRARRGHGRAHLEFPVK